MSELWTSRTRARRRRAPQRITGINWNSPFARDLLTAHSAHARRDWVTGDAVTNSSTPVVASRFGPAWDFNNSRTVDIGSRFIGPDTPGFASYCVFMYRAFANLDGIVGTTNSASHHMILRLRSSTGAKLEAPFGGMIGSTALSALTWYSGGLSWEDKVSRKLYLNGAVEVDGGTPTAVGPSGIYTINHIGRDYTTRYLDGQVPLYLQWDKVKSDGFMREIHKAPWDWARTETRVVFIPAAAGGATIAAKAHHHRQMMAS